MRCSRSLQRASVERDGAGVAGDERSVLPAVSRREPVGVAAGGDGRGAAGRVAAGGLRAAVRVVSAAAPVEGAVVVDSAAVERVAGAAGGSTGLVGASARVDPLDAEATDADGSAGLDSDGDVTAAAGLASPVAAVESDG